MVVINLGVRSYDRQNFELNESRGAAPFVPL